MFFRVGEVSGVEIIALNVRIVVQSWNPSRSIWQTYQHGDSLFGAEESRKGKRERGKGWLGQRGVYRSKKKGIWWRRMPRWGFGPTFKSSKRASARDTGACRTFRNNWRHACMADTFPRAAKDTINVSLVVMTRQTISQFSTTPLTYIFILLQR